MNKDTDKKITVEDLLRLKRAERPPVEFWAKFDAEIRAKQLSAIVSRRPWWDGLSRGFALVRRMQLPMGAAAAVALTWVGVHYAGSRTVAVQEFHPAAAQAHAAAPSVASIPAPVKLSTPAPEAAEVAVHRDAPAPSSVVASTSSHLVQAPAFAATEAPADSPFANGIAVTLSDYRNSIADLVKTTTFGNDREFEPSVAQARQPASDPLARMDPAEERRARLLAPALASGPRALASDWMKERASHNDRMYESMDDHTSSDSALVGFRF
ncbi:MAG TPA: hypothetical protein VIJ19_05105 [Opitutaceae bacterium]